MTGAPPKPADGSARDAPTGLSKPRRSGRNAIVVGLSTALARVASLGREVLSASYFGVSGQMSAFTVAFQIPNLMRSLFADSALQGAFIPVFSKHLERGERREAIRTASAVATLLGLGLGLLTVVFVLLAPVLVPFLVPGFADSSPDLVDATVTLAQIMMPVTVLISLSGVLAGMLNALDHFTLPAIAPFLWNLVIVAVLVTGVTFAPAEDEIYVYAVGVLVGSVAQFLLPIPLLRRMGFGLARGFNLRSPHVRAVFTGMLPVTVALGLMNFAVLVNTLIASFVSEAAPAAIDKAYRLWQLPQGVFSVAVATVMFPTLARLAARGAMGDLRQTTLQGSRTILVVLVPTATLMALLAEPIVRVVYERGEFDARATELTAEALRLWALSMPFAGVSSLLWRVFFSLDERRKAAAFTVTNLAVNTVVALALYQSLGVRGILMGTVAGTGLMVAMQVVFISRRVQAAGLARASAQMVPLVIAGVISGLAGWVIYTALEPAIGGGLVGDLVGLTAAAIGSVVAMLAVGRLLRVQEVRAVRTVPGRLR